MHHPTLLDQISHHARTRPADLAMAFVSPGVPDVELSWRDLEDSIRRLGRHLQERGIGPGDVVLVLAAAPREQALGFLGAMACGGVPTILSFPSVKQSERRFLEMLGSVVENSRARWVLASAELSGVISPWIDSGEGTVGLIEFPDVAALEGLCDPVRPEGQPLFLQFSSGTTGARKGIAVTLEMFAVQASSYGTAMEMGPADRIANWLPLYHDNGLVGCFLLPLYRGSASIHLAPFEWVENPVSVFEVVHRYRATLLWSPNFAFSFCARRIAPEQLRGLRLDSLRAFLTGGELVRESSRRELLERFAGTGLEERHLQVCYGMAENTFVSNQTDFGAVVRKDVVDRRAFFETNRAVPLAPDAPPGSGLTFYSCGRPLPDHQARIGGAGEDRQVGEVEILSGCLFEGYLSASGVSREGVFTADGWYRSGDQGYIVDGELFCTGRLKDLIIHRGVNLHPEDLQEVIGRIPGVKDGRVVVFGVADEAEGTERIVALLEPDGPAEGAGSAGNAGNAGRLARRVREEVSSTFGVNVHDVRVCAPGTLLKSTSGKISRKANRAFYLETFGTAPARRESEAVAPRDPWEAELVEIWRQVLGVEALGVTDDLFLDLGASSLTALSAVGEIRERLGREVEPHDLMDRETVERQAELLRVRAEAGAREEGRALVALRSGGANVPLFLIHPAGGSPFSYLGLARRLGTGQPVYAFRDPHLSSGGGAFGSVEEMAAEYVRELVAFRPGGPYALGGWSLGGMVAFEMASQLAEQGREVSLLLMLDTFRPVGSLTQSWFQAGRSLNRKVLHTFGAGRLFSLLQGGGAMPPGRRLLAIAYADYDCYDPRVIEKSFPGLCEPAELRRLPPEERWEYVYRRLREQKLAREIPGVTAASLRRENRLFAVHHALNDRYRPRRTYPGRITLFLKRGHANPLGWKRYTAQPLDVHEFDLRPTAGLPDAHLAMMQDENVDLYAAVLRGLLDRLG